MQIFINNFNKNMDLVIIIVECMSLKMKKKVKLIVLLLSLIRNYSNNSKIYYNLRIIIDFYMVLKMLYFFFFWLRSPVLINNIKYKLNI